MTAATIATTVTGLQGRPISTIAPTANQALGWTGSAWLGTGPYLPITGGSISGNLTVTGAASAASVQTPGPSGTFLNGPGVNLITGRALAVYNLFSSPFTTTINASFVMTGAQAVITPKTSGLIMCFASVQIANGSANSSTSVGIRIGTGAPPTAGQTGTPGNQAPGYGMGLQNTTNSVGIWVPWSQVGMAGNCTIGTQYWWDFMVGVSGNAATAYMQWGSLQLIEI